MIIWNSQKVNSFNSALKPLPKLPEVSKAAYVWDILIYQAPVTFRFSGNSHGAYLQLEYIAMHWSTLKEFDGNPYLLTFKLSDECMRVVRATPGGYRKSWNCEGVYFGAFPPIVFNFPKSQIGLLIFSSWPGGPKCLKYQNVPYMHKFWHIGKPWGRF